MDDDENGRSGRTHQHDANKSQVVSSCCHWIQQRSKACWKDDGKRRLKGGTTRKVSGCVV